MNILHKLYSRLKEWFGTSNVPEHEHQPAPPVVPNPPPTEPDPPVVSNPLPTESDPPVVSNPLPTEPDPPVEVPVSPPSTASDDQPLSDLEKLLAEEGIDLNSVAEERPETAQGMSAKEWLIATSDDDLIKKQLDTDN